jgi:hypothetical protein
LKAFAVTTFPVEVARNNLASLSKLVLSYEVLQAENFGQVHHIRVR